MDNPAPTPANTLTGPATQTPSSQPLWKQQTPNALSIARCFITVGIVVLLGTAPAPHQAMTNGVTGEPTTDWRLLVATVAFVIAAFTDMLDGHLARKWCVVSRFGRIIDPFADKALVLGTLACLAGPAYTVMTQNAAENTTFVQITGVSIIVVVIVLIRELLVTSIRAVYEADGYDFSAGTFGKLKMILQSACIPFVMLVAGLGYAAPGSTWLTVCVVLMWVTAGMTAVSAWPYLRRVWQQP